jgi:hypothetical protein
LSHSGNCMIAPSVMNLTAPPAFTDHCIGMIDDGVDAAAILVTRALVVRGPASQVDPAAHTARHIAYLADAGANGAAPRARDRMVAAGGAGRDWKNPFR